jgi:hypothetical protein
MRSTKGFAFRGFPTDDEGDMGVIGVMGSARPEACANEVISDASAASLQRSLMPTNRHRVVRAMC